MIEGKEGHISYLKTLKKMCKESTDGGDVLPSFPLCEGALYWSRFMDLFEYTDRYEKECIKRGWLEA